MVVNGTLAAEREPAAAEPSGVQQTDLGPIPSDWKIGTLGELVDPNRTIRYGIVQPGKYSPRGRYMIRGQDYAAGWADPEDLFRVSDAVEYAYKNARVKSGDILITIVGASTGRIAVVPDWLEGANLTQTTARIAIVPTRADSRYCAYALGGSYGRTQTINYMKGGAQPGLNCGDVERFLVPLPPTLAEQKAIAQALTDAAALSEALERLIAKKRAVKEGMISDLLSGQVRLSGFAVPWQSRTLGEICRITMGRTPPRANSKYWGKGYAWLSIADLKSRFVSESKEQISRLGVEGMEIVPVGTLLMSFKLSIGKLCFAGTDLYTNEAICALRNIVGDASFMYYALGRTDFSVYGKQAVKGFTLNKESLGNVVVPYPEHDEQRAIARVLTDIDDELEALEARLSKVRLMKQGMMQELLTGRIRLV